MKGPLTLLALLVVLAAVSPIAPAASGPARPDVQDPALAVVQGYVLLIDDEADVPPKQVPPPPPPPIVVDNTPRVGSKGPAVLAIEQRLESLGYLTGSVDGTFDRSTSHGVMAFQKVEGLPRTGKGDPGTLDRLATAARPTAKYSTPPDHIEVDIPRQVVFVVRAGRVAHILPTSTGSGKLFTNQGWTRRAITPNGRFRVTRKINAMRISPLGELYKPSYFDGGIAFHGNGAVPPFPASHGCVRLPMPFADWFFHNAAPIGMPVYVYGGPNGANPQPFIEDKPAEPSPAPSQAVEPSPTPTGEPSPSPSPNGVTTTASS